MSNLEEELVQVAPPTSGTLCQVATKSAQRYVKPRGRVMSSRTSDLRHIMSNLEDAYVKSHLRLRHVMLSLEEELCQVVLPFNLTITTLLLS
jgi:hypothetical protein